MQGIDEQIRLCIPFQRCVNYPKTADGVLSMARGLERAHEVTGVPMERIVEECCTISVYCPTDADFMNVARDIRGPEKAEDLPKPRCEVVRKQWQQFEHQFPQIMENGRKWEEDFKRICALVRNKMGMERWMKTTSIEKVRTALEMGLPVLHKPESKYKLEDCGLGIFVARRKLTDNPAQRAGPKPAERQFAGKDAAGGRDA